MGRTRHIRVVERAMASLGQWWRRRQTARQIAQARDRGVGLYTRAWELPQAEGDERELSPVESVLGWCRETLGRCRRPWGIDYFDLTIACSGPDALPVRSARFTRMRPIDLYQDGDIAAQIAALLIGAAAAGGEQLRIAASLFSWGDATHAALPATA
jgi:hypothetical protein